MTTERPVADTNEWGAFVVKPREETVIQGTPYIAWHDGDENAHVDVMEDGALELSGSTMWIVGLAATWRGAR